MALAHASPHASVIAATSSARAPRERSQRRSSWRTWESTCGSAGMRRRMSVSTGALRRATSATSSGAPSAGTSASITRWQISSADAPAPALARRRSSPAVSGSPRRSTSPSVYMRIASPGASETSCSSWVGYGSVPSVGAKSRAQLAHQRRRAHAVARDVADRQPDLPARELDHVVPVAAHHRLRRRYRVDRRNEARRDVDPRDVGHALGEQAALQRHRTAVLMVERVEQPRALDRRRRAGRRQLQQRRVVVGEPMRPERADVHDAGHAPLDDQGRAEQRAHALLAQDRVDDVGVIGVGDEDRHALGRDAPGKAAAERDAHAALDLLLEPARGARDQLLAVLVEHEDRGGVDAERLLGAIEELEQQRVEPELGEHRVAEPVHVRQLRRPRRGRGRAGAAEHDLPMAALGPVALRRCGSGRGQVREYSTASRMSGIPAIEYPPELPISRRRDDLLAAIRDHQVVVVAGETGSGKTTQLPKLCLELGRGAIAHTQPRRLAARTVAQQIDDELRTPLGGAVGYAVRFSDRSGEDTRVRLMTDGLLLAETRRDRLLRRYDTIIVDEAHERSLNIDFLLGYVKRILPRRPDLRLIVTSATIDPEQFSAHFGDAPVVEVSGRTYPVE